MPATPVPTISYDGVEIPDYGERLYPYGILEVTRHCNLRCTTCFFFQAFAHEEGDVADAELVAKLKALAKRHRIKFMSWVGGEPLLRKRVVEHAAEIVPGNVIFTNGTVALPDWPVTFAVSLDGLEEVNDAIRGTGVFERARRTIAQAPRRVLVQTVVSRRNLDVLPAFTDELAGWPKVAGVIFSIYVPQQGDASGLAFELSARDELLDRLLELKRRHGAFVVNEEAALELARPATCREVTDGCDMRENSLALDYRLERRTPCCYGEKVDCDLCAAPTPFSLAARARGLVSGTDHLAETIRRLGQR